MNPFGYHPIPKNTYKSKKRSTDFPLATRKAIIERDGGLCVRCRRKGEHIHHISYRSEHTEDVNHKRNGALVCSSCHYACHHNKEIREWFRKFKMTCLDEKGDLINDQ